MVEGSAPLQAVYRRVAQKVHPDRADDKVEIDPRTILMARANQAREAGNLAALERVERDWQRLNVAYATVYNRCATSVCVRSEQERWVADFYEKARRAYRAADCEDLDTLAAIDVPAALDRLAGQPNGRRATAGPGQRGEGAAAGSHRRAARRKGGPDPGRSPHQTRAKPQTPPPMSIGDRVLHWKFGSGVVLDRKVRREGPGQPVNFVVRFKSPHGLKELRQDLAGLERL